MHMHVDTYYTYKAESPSDYLSACTFWCADNSVVSALIEMGLGENDSCVLEDHIVHFRFLQNQLITDAGMQNAQV